MIQVTFDNPDVTLDNVQGYRITARLNPQEGFKKEFYVYVVARFAGRSRMDPVTFGDEAGAMSGKLDIAGEGRSYSFEPALLTRVHSGATRRERFQVLEFQVDWSDPRDQPTVTLDNDDDVELARLNTLEDDFTMSLDGDTAEHLLGFSSLQSDHGSPVYRFSSLRNRNNGWLPAAIAWHEAIHNNEENSHELGLEFAQGDFSLTRTTTNLLYIDESYGVCHTWGGLALRDVVGSLHGRGQGSGVGVRLPVWSYEAADFIQHENEQLGEYESAPSRRAVETATVVFRGSNYHRLEIS
jgi:hypothetical protein